MKAAVLHAKNDLRCEEVEKPVPRPDEVLVKISYCGICGSDMPRVLQGTAHYFPIILGHEFSGVVEAVGTDEAVSYTHLDFEQEQLTFTPVAMDNGAGQAQAEQAPVG